jgi:trk system potassium uptake protein TrkH
VGASLRESAFSVTSIMTTTGYTTADFDDWSSFARMVFLVLFACGACAGSTAGGMKVIRVVLLGRAARQELDRQVQPARVRVLRFGGHSYSEGVRRAVLGYFLVYALVFVLGSLAMAATGIDPVSAISGSSSAINIIGPALGEIGPAENWEAMPGFGRAVAILMMIAGRLEVFTVVALLAALVQLGRGRF